MITVDSSVVVAAFARWHEQHLVARDAVRASDILLGHVAAESYSVLTRLPPPRRVGPEPVRAFLDHHFPPPWPWLDDEGYHDAIARAESAGIVGGAVYDALIGWAARQASATLLSLDDRATQTYAKVGADHEILA